MIEKFTPHPNMKKVYYTYLAIVAIPLILGGVGVTLAVYVYSPSPALVWVPILSWVVPCLAIACFIAYWIPKYYDSISYALTGDEVIVERGVWWKLKHVVPYSRVMSVDVVQGPISRRFGVGTIDVFTAGYTGMGGTAGPGTRRAEASILCVSNFMELREKILSFVRHRPLFEAPGIGTEMLKELRQIRAILQKQTRRG
jgi:membrane protein YdbS with pleckstrin-like domain